MYTEVVRKKREATPTELGYALKQWRRDNGDLTVEAAAERIEVVKSTWSNIETGRRKASMETLIALSSLLGRTVEDLAAIDGRVVHRSRTNEDRHRRSLLLAEKTPAAAALLDLLPELTAGEIDTLLTVGEGMARNRKDRR